MSRTLRDLLKGVLIGFIAAPVVWVLLGRPGLRESQDAVPSDANRPRPLLQPREVRLLRPEPLDAAERSRGEDALRRLRTRWREEHEAMERAQAEGRYGCGTRSPGIFYNEWLGGGTELRLFVLGYPELAERWAQAAAESSEAVAWEKGRGTVALGELAAASWGAAESVLVRLCRQPHEHFRFLAQYHLQQADRVGKHRAMFRELAKKGELAAIEALSYWTGSEEREILEAARTKWVGLASPKGDVHYYAQESLVLLDTLESSAGEEFCRQVLTEREYAVGEWRRVGWALRIARARRAPWLAEMLRAELSLRMKWGLGPSLARDGRRDDRFDLYLLTLAEVGGDLEEEEKAYLKHYGYGCEPRARLAEILEEKRYPR